MKVIVKDETPVIRSKDKYPHLGIYSDGTIVLFHAKGKGTCLISVDCYIAQYEFRSSWADTYSLFDGEIILRND